MDCYNIWQKFDCNPTKNGLPQGAQLKVQKPLIQQMSIVSGGWSLISN